MFKSALFQWLSHRSHLHGPGASELVRLLSLAPAERAAASLRRGTGPPVVG